ncbi:MAG: hypothetical protein RBU30_21215, partial [Polyangia bacterium]|nr:hypothetical protein [Polyangia bacterium]
MNAKPLSEVTAPLDSRSIEDLEDEITLLSATIQAATCRLLLLVGEVDRRGLWSDPLGSSHRSSAHWLSQRASLDL